MVCRMKKNPDLSQDCYERVIQALHVTLADIIRGVKEVLYQLLQDVHMYEPHHEKTRFLHMPKQRRRSASR